MANTGWSLLVSLARGQHNCEEGEPKSQEVRFEKEKRKAVMASARQDGAAAAAYHVRYTQALFNGE